MRKTRQGMNRKMSRAIFIGEVGEDARLGLGDVLRSDVLIIAAFLKAVESLVGL